MDEWIANPGGEPTTAVSAHPGGRRVPPLPARIVVGVDDAAGSDDAVALALALGGAEASMIVASVRPFWPESIPRADRQRIVEEEEAALRRQLARRLGGRAFATRVLLGGNPGNGLKEVAEAEEADLIVIGSTRRGRLGRVLPGSVGERVLDGAPCAVAVASRGFAETEAAPFGRIVVACDGSRESLAALRLAGALAARDGARLSLVGVVAMRFDLAGFPRPADPEEVTRIERALARARAGLPPGLEVEVSEIHGVPAQMIIAVARDADLLAIGSRGNYGPLRRLFLGSVAAGVVREAPCATLIVPAA